MNDKTILVTGASSGIGKEIAIGLAVAGAHVIIVCRNAVKSQAALDEIKMASGSEKIDLLIADLASLESIQALAETINHNYPKLNALVNNAGAVSSKKMLTKEGMELTFATNFLGPLRLTKALQSLLQKSAPARVINVTSAIHKWATIDWDDLQFEKRRYHFMKAYAQSKLLLNILSFDLAKKWENFGITINCVHPGAVKTGLGSDNSHGFFLKWIDKIIKFFFLTPKQAAKPIIDLVLSPQYENITGKYFVKGKVTQPSKASLDLVLAAKCQTLIS